jgi:hypothetical protein
MRRLGLAISDSRKVESISLLRMPGKSRGDLLHNGHVNS